MKHLLRNFRYDEKQIFPFKVKPGSYETMVKVLKFPLVTGPEMNDQLYRGNPYGLSARFVPEKGVCSAI